MGTRGVTGLVIGGELKVGYQQYDSYPSGVGIDVLKELRVLVKDMDAFRLAAHRLQVVKSEEEPIPVEVPQRLRDAGLEVQNANGGDIDWYWLLRDTQGSIDLKLKAGYVVDASDFPTDSLFCEWGYIVDLDQGTFEIYEGFQNESPTAGRWKGLPVGNGGYYPCELKQVFSLEDLPDDDTFLDLIESNEG